MWELLYETFWDRLEHFCYKLCRDEARAEDLTQEVFLRALQNRTLIDAFTERQCKAWLFAAARNLYCDQVRRAAKEEALLTSLLPPDGDDSAETLRQYEALVVNGKATCPASLAALFTEAATVNGKLVIYPDEAVVLSGRSVKLDRAFLLRAQERLYWNERLFVAVDPKLDAAALAAKGCRFAAPKAVLAESLAETLAPLFTEDTELVILPDGTAVVDDDLDLTAAALRRYGTKLYVLGDVTVAADCIAALGKLEFFHASGTVTLPQEAEETFCAIPDLAYDELRVLSGHLFSGLPKLTLTPDLLAQYPEGIACVDCAMVRLDPALLPDEIAKHCQFDGCALVQCTEVQQNAVAAVSRNVAKIHASQKDGPLSSLFDPDTASMQALQLTL